MENEKFQETLQTNGTETHMVTPAPIEHAEVKSDEEVKRIIGEIAKNATSTTEISFKMNCEAESVFGNFHFSFKYENKKST